MMYKITGDDRMLSNMSGDSHIYIYMIEWIYILHMVKWKDFPIQNLIGKDKIPSPRLISGGREMEEQSAKNRYHL